MILDALAFLIFNVTAGWGIVWSLRQEGRLFQLPSLLGAASMAFIVPQGNVIMKNPSLVPDGVQFWFYLWSSLCLIVAYVSYFKGWRVRNNIRHLSNHHIANVGMVLLALACVAFVVIAKDHSSQEDGAIQMEVTGFQVIVYTVVKLAIPGMALLVSAFYLGKRGWLPVAFLVAGLIVMLYFSIFLGRRQWIFALIFVISYPGLLVGKFRLPRLAEASILAVFLLVVPLIVILFPQYRSSVTEGDGAFARALKEKPPLLVIKHYFDGYINLELTESMLRFDLAISGGEYGYGRGLFNNLIHHYVPAQIVGRELKDDMMVDVTEADELAYQEYGMDYQTRFYISRSGFSDSYTEFGIFGILLYYALGKIFSFTSIKWSRYRDRRFLVFLVLFGLYPMLFVYGQWSVFLSLSLSAVFIYILLCKFSREASFQRLKRRASRISSIPPQQEAANHAG